MNQWYHCRSACQNGGVGMPPSRGGVDSIAIRSTRSGQPTASASAMFDPQSCPATMKRSMPSASSSAIWSSAWTPLFPVRGAPSWSRVPPNPRKVGTIVRKPARRSRGATASQVEASSGRPWRSRTTGPSPSSR